MPPAANLATAASGVALDDLAARVGVDLGIENQDVDVAATGQNVVQATKADIIGPAIAADDPDRLLDQLVGQAHQVAHSRLFEAGQLGFQLDDPLTLGLDLCVGLLCVAQQRSG